MHGNVVQHLAACEVDDPRLVRDAKPHGDALGQQRQHRGVFAAQRLETPCSAVSIDEYIREPECVSPGYCQQQVVDLLRLALRVEPHADHQAIGMLGGDQAADQLGVEARHQAVIRPLGQCDVERDDARIATRDGRERLSQPRMPEREGLGKAPLRLLVDADDDDVLDRRPRRDRAHHALRQVQGRAVETLAQRREMQQGKQPAGRHRT